MRIDNANFENKNVAPAKDPLYVVRVSNDFDNTDFHYFLSDSSLPSGLAPSAGDYTLSCITGISGTSQRVDPIDAVSTIGGLTIKISDPSGAVTDHFRTKQDGGEGLRNKQVKIYIGYKDLAWSDYITPAGGTQIVYGDVVWKDDEYTINCSDVQRFTKKNIFDVAKTNITQVVYPGDTTINVLDTSDFSMVAHGTSYSDSPSATVGYIKITKGAQIEIVKYTGKTSTTFTGCTRGALNSPRNTYEYNADKDDDKQFVVEEYVYLEMPILKLIYAILTGVLYGQGGAVLPSGWHCGVDVSLVALADFTGAGVDLWDSSDDTLGFIARFEGETKTDAKKFIEEQLYLLAGGFPKIHGDGEMGFQRFTNVGQTGAFTYEFNDRNVVSFSGVTFDQRDVYNSIQIEWNWSPAEKRFTRKNTLVDTDSSSIFGTTETKTLSFRGLHGSIHAVERLNQVFDFVRDRYAGPAKHLTVTTRPEENILEVGDPVMFNASQFRDLSIPDGTSRVWEITQADIDWITGQVTFALFGSSHYPVPIAYSGTTGNVVADAYYTAAGTELTAWLDANYPGTYSEAGGTLTLNSDAQLTGGNTLTLGRYYYAGNITIGAGVRLTVTNNVYLVVQGFLTINGNIYGVGQGSAGGSAPASPTAFTDYGVGTAGAFGARSSGGALQVSTENNKFFIRSRPGGYQVGNYVPTLPPFNIKVSGSSISGLPPVLKGTSGPSGCPFGYRSGVDVFTFYQAGDGGASGAGLCILSRGGAFGGSGYIDLSGADGSLAPSLYQYTIGTTVGTFSPGVGAGGGPGALLWLHDGVASSPTFSYDNADRNAGTVRLWDGATKTSNRFPTTVSLVSGDQGTPIPNLESYYVGKGPATNGPLFWVQSPHSADAARLIFLKDDLTPQSDPAPYSDEPLSLSLQEVKNKPVTPKGELSTIEITVTPPSDDNFYYAVIYYRKTSDTDADYYRIGTGPEATVIVFRDGTDYTFQARSVSKSTGEETTTGPTQTITVSNIQTPAQTDPAPDTENPLQYRVTHLQIAGQGNNTEWTGKDIVFTWTRSASIDGTNWYRLGTEPAGLGLGAGYQESYFKDYQVEVYDSNMVLLRRFWTTDGFFVYTHENNVEDSIKQKQSEPYRNIIVWVWARSNNNRLSERAGKLDVSNPVPNVPTGLSLIPAFNSIAIKFVKPADLDYVGVIVYLSTSQGFTPAVTDIVYKGPDSYIVIPGLLPATTYYIVISPYDQFGETGILQSTELSTTTLQVTTVDLEDLLITTAKLVDSAVEEAKLAGGAVTAAKIAAGAIIAGKIAAGTIVAADIAAGAITANKLAASLVYAGSIQLATGGQIYSGQTSLNNGTGFFLGDNSGTKVFSIGDGISKGVYFDGTDFAMLRDTQLQGADAYNNNAFYYNTYFDSLDGSNVALVGSGSVSSYLGILLYLTSGATDQASVNKFGLYSPALTFTKNRRIKFTLNTGVGIADNVDYWFVTGNLSGAAPDFFGFKMVDGDLYGVSSNLGKSGETLTTSFQTLSENSSYLLEAIFTAGTSVYFYIDGVELDYLTTNLPVSESDGRVIYYFLADNTGTPAGSKSLTIGNYKLLQDE